MVLTPIKLECGTRQKLSHDAKNLVGKLFTVFKSLMDGTTNRKPWLSSQKEKETP